MYNDNYEDIIELPHHRSKTRVPMSISERSAQFSPFSALTGHNTAIKETERLTESRKELSESEIDILNIKLLEILSKIEEKQWITITYFTPDNIKSGGKYVTKNGYIKKYNEYEHYIVLDNNIKIYIDDIIYIDNNIKD